MQYDPSVFLNVDSVEAAQAIILTPEAGMTVAHRWNTETPYLVDLIGQHLEPKSKILDFGCGIGRLSKPLIGLHEATVVGVDISPNMRALASSCVDSPRFVAMDPILIELFPDGLFDFAIAIWVLQHCVNPQIELDRIVPKLKSGAKFFVVNNVTRALPTTQGTWVHDGIDIHQLIVNNGFVQLQRGQLNTDIAPGCMQENTFWAVYMKS